MTSVPKNVNIDKLADIFNKYNNTYCSTIKMKAADVKSSTYIDLNKKNDKEDPKFEVGDHVKILKYKNIFAKGYTLNWREDVFMIKKVKNIAPLTYVISDLICKEIFERFCKKELQKTNQKVFRVEREERKSREKMINYMLNGKVMVVLLIVG